VNQVQENQQPDRVQQDGTDSTVTVAARYGFLGFIGQFVCPPDVALTGLSNSVVIQTDRGIEIGWTVNLTCPQASSFPMRAEQIAYYVEACGGEYLRSDAGRILRVASEQDLAEQRRLDEAASQKLVLCRQLAEQQGLAMKLVACEHLFGGERIVFYFTAEGRVDFRQLVRDLAHEYQTRIELRQIGARDEARLVADYEICGRECCCKTFLKTLRPVSMKMAKLQKATLDPSKVSGRCGRLRCCLRYEHETYQTLGERLPRIDSVVRTDHGLGRVIGRQILTQLVQLDMGDGRLLAVPVEEIRQRDLPDSLMSSSSARQGEQAAGEAGAAGPAPAEPIAPEASRQRRRVGRPASGQPEPPAGRGQRRRRRGPSQGQPLPGEAEPNGAGGSEPSNEPRDETNTD
jgi:cell fate regulator YaaT (PSP1 superfamily)